MLKVFGFALSFLIALNAWSSPNHSAPLSEFYYRIKIPKTNLTCEQEAKLLALKFANITQYEAVTGQCKGSVNLQSDGKTYELYSLMVTYKTTYFPKLDRATLGHPDFSGIPRDFEGIYATFESCLNDISNQTRLYQLHSGLPLIDATCEPASYSDKPSFVLRIDGFGQPLKKLYGAKLSFMGDATEANFDEVKTLLQKLGASIIVSMGHEILYYSDPSFRFAHDYFAKFYSKEQCTSQLAEAQTIVTKFGSKDAVVTCLPFANSVYFLEAFREGYFDVNGDDGAKFPEFYSFEECMSERAATTLGNPYGGGICHVNNHLGTKFILELFSRY